jgi:hypothetical protein
VVRERADGSRTQIGRKPDLDRHPNSADLVTGTSAALDTALAFDRQYPGHTDKVGNTLATYSCEKHVTRAKLGHVLRACLSVVHADDAIEHPKDLFAIVHVPLL